VDLNLLSEHGDDVYISDKAEIRRPHLLNLGSHIAIDAFFYCTTSLVINDYVHISPHVSCIGGPNGIVSLLGFNNIMAGARLIAVSDRFDDSGLFGALIPLNVHGKIIKEPIAIEPFANVGTNSVVLPGSRLRAGSLLSVGSVLMDDTEPWTIYKGNPALPIKKINNAKILECAKQLGYYFCHDSSTLSKVPS